jgi:hypothetical protein
MTSGTSAGAKARVLKWTLAIPFFLMPLPLTLLAWDLYGGFAIHWKLLLGLSTIGASIGLALERRAELRALLQRFLRTRTEASGDAEDNTDSGVERLTVLGLLLLIISQLLVSMSLITSSGIARSLKLWNPDEGEASPDSIFVRVVFALFVLLIGLRINKSAHFGGAVAILWLTLTGSSFLALTTPFSPWMTPVLLVVVLSLVHFRVARSQATKPTLLDRGAVALSLLATIWLLLSRAPQVLFNVDPRGTTIGLTVLAVSFIASALVMVVMPRKGWVHPLLQHLSQQLLTNRASKTPNDTFSSFLAVAAGLTLALLTIPVSAASFLCGDLFRSALEIDAASTTPMNVSGELLTLQGVLLIGLVRIGSICRTGLELKRAGYWIGMVFLVGTWAGFVKTPSAVQEVSKAGMFLFLVAAPWTPRVWESQSFHRAAEWVFILAPVPICAVAARYVSAAFPLIATPLTLVSIGAVFGFALGLFLTEFQVPDELKPKRLLIAAILTPLALGLLIYLGVFFSVASTQFFLSVLTLVGVTALSRSRHWSSIGLPPISIAVSLWLLFYTSFIGVVYFKNGPNQESCGDVIESTSARVLLDRFGEGGEYPSGMAYDLLTDESGQWLVTTFKRFDDRGGWIEVIDINQPELRTRTTTKPRRKSSPFWPERFVSDPITGHFYFGMLGIDSYELWEMELRTSPEIPTPHLQLLRSVPMDWEPSYPDIDSHRGLLIQSYLSAGVETSERRNIEQPLVQRIDLRSLESKDSWSMGPDVQEMSEFVKVHPTSYDYYVPGYFDLVRFALVEVDGDTLSLKRHKDTFHPTIALGFDSSGNRMYVTNSLGGTLEQYDLDSFRRTATVRSGSFPRDLVIDPSRQRVFVGNYSEGTVVEFDISGPSPLPLATTEVGPLLRGITIHPESGTVYAASSCGVFQINPDAS